MAGSTSLLEERLIAIYTAEQATQDESLQRLCSEIVKHRVARMIDLAEQQGELNRIEGIKSYADALSIECQLMNAASETAHQ